MKSLLKWIIIILLIVIVISVYLEYRKESNAIETTITNVNTIESIDLLELPDDKNLIEYKAFHLSYNEEYEQANWVAYSLTCKETKGSVKRTNRFREDSRIVTNSAEDDDYRNSGYDRGHLMPAADCSWDLEVMNESFLFSNISPQEASFNRGIWKKLEDRTRELACIYDSIYIITGPIFTNNMKRIGKNKVAVPEYFFKAFLNYRSKEAVAFIIPNSKTDMNIWEFAISVDSLESRLSFDLFYKLDDEIEREIESKVNYQHWFEPIN